MSFGSVKSLPIGALFALVALQGVTVASVEVEGKSTQQQLNTPLLVKPAVGQMNAPIDVSIRGTERKARVYLPNFENAAPIFEGVTGYTDTGLPISRFKRMKLDMAKKIADAYLKEEERLVRAGKIKPRVLRDIWAERQAEIDAREAKEGPSVTKTFIIPGTTPSQSEAIHNDTAGMRIESEKVVFVNTKDPLAPIHSIALNDSNESATCSTGVCELPLKNTEGTKHNHYPSYKSESGQPIKAPKGSAEERMLNFFPDLKKFSPFTYLERGFELLVKPSYAVDLDAVESLAKENQKIRENTIEKGATKESLLNSQATDQNTAERMKKMEEIAQSVLDQTRQKQNSQRQATSPAEKQVIQDTFVFVSYSLGDVALKNILMWASTQPHVTLVMRGVPEGQNLGKGILRMQSLAAQFDPIPTVVIDPTLFSEYGIKAVPSVVIAERLLKHLQPDPNKRTVPKLIAKAEGLANDTWLKEKILAGDRGNLGQQGEIFPILEPDMIEVLKQRVAKVDWEAKKAQAIKRFWDKQSFIALPQATENRIRDIDPSVMATAAIRDANGNIVVPAGTRINPLEKLPYTEALLIFNPNVEVERGWVKMMLDALKREGKYTNIMVIATEMDRAQGWDGYEKLTDELDRHVYLLVKEVQNRFEIQATPTLVTADNDRKVFVVKEYLLQTNEGENK